MDYLERLDSYHDEMLQTLENLVAFPSVKGDAVKTADGEVLPFGRNVDDALQYTLKKGAELGFSTFNAENYGGHIEFKSEEENAENFAIVGHLDVVPEGIGWDNEPYKMTEKDGYVYGRGVSDDKGPVLACLYAMTAIKESGIKPKKNIRLILGLDEETGFTGINHYLERAGQPDLGFTPDGEFPLINGEKGIMVFDLVRKFSKPVNKEGLRLTKLEAGLVSNAVPAGAKAVVAADDNMYSLIKDRLAQYVVETGYDVRARKQGTSLVIESKGLAAHGALPQLGLNAVSIIMDFLGRLQFANEELNDFIAYYNEHIGFNVNGEKCGCGLEDEVSGKLTFNVGVATISEELATLTVNVRFPVTCTSDQVFEGIEKTLESTQIGIVKQSVINPIFMDENHPMVKTLMGVYKDVTGEADARPCVIGGGTYAKAVNNTLAFGALFPGEEDTMHQANERMSIESYFKMARIYAQAIYSICCE